MLCGGEGPGLGVRPLQVCSIGSLQTQTLLQVQIKVDSEMQYTAQ